MEKIKNNIIYTIGHSTNTIYKFIEILKFYEIEIIADVRSLPGSRRFPQFNKENLEISLQENEIGYIHITKLGGRRKADINSKNISWRNPSFRAYADYMETADFRDGVEELLTLARMQRAAIMCAEVLWWRCHRSMISDYLKSNGWKVIHITSIGKTEEHPYTKPAKIINGKLDYSSDNLFDDNLGTN